jgi:RNA polymerase sigma factor (sigma-70 family)
MAAARFAARKVRIDGYELHELEYEALLRIVCDFGKIRTSPFPAALARRIAKQHLQDVQRQESNHADHYQAVSHVLAPAGFQDDEDSWEDQSTSTKLDYVAGSSLVDVWWRARSTQGIFDRLRAAIESLDKQDRRIIELFFGFDEHLGCLSVQEIAEELNLPESSVYRRRSAALKKLKLLLGDLQFRRTRR